MALLFPLFISRGFQFTLFIALHDRPSRPAASVSHRDFVKVTLCLRQHTHTSAHAHIYVYMYIKRVCFLELTPSRIACPRICDIFFHLKWWAYTMVNVMKPFKNASCKNLTMIVAYKEANAFYALYFWGKINQGKKELNIN